MELKDVWDTDEVEEDDESDCSWLLEADEAKEIDVAVSEIVDIGNIKFNELPLFEFVKFKFLHCSLFIRPFKLNNVRIDWKEYFDNLKLRPGSSRIHNIWVVINFFTLWTREFVLCNL